MSVNRLKLDFSLETAEERKKFLDEYVQRAEFITKPPTDEELETMGNYLLWGRDENGKNSVQNKLVQIQTKNGTWDKKEDESLDGLMEQPTFNEASLISINGPRLKVARENFDRQKALLTCPSSLVPIFEVLFLQIDRLDLMLNYWDLAHGKRKNPPREELLARFSPEEQEEIREEATHYNQFKYLKARHLLVELRRQQFTLKDSYSSSIQRHTLPIYEQSPGDVSFETEIKVYPLGLNNKGKVGQLLFRKKLDPNEYSEEELKIISYFLFNKKEECARSTSKDFVIDFRELEHVYNIFLLYFDLEDESLKEELESETDSLLKTLYFYVNMANLTEVQREILNLKMKKTRNQDISSYINQKYNKSYTANYISTIFRQKIIKQINEAAAFHLEIIENIFFPENFKRCSTCGEIKLKNSENFVKKTRAKDGYSNRCKRCDKIERDKKKEKKING